MNRQRSTGVLRGGLANQPFFCATGDDGGSLVDSISRVFAACSISGTRYGIVNGVVTQFPVNQPPIEDDGLRGCPAFTQYFLNNEAPITQSITLAAGTYCLWIEGSGSAIFNGLTATAGAPKVFTLESGFAGDCVITGTVTKAMLNSGLFPAPFSPTQGVTKSFVSEAATGATGGIVAENINAFSVGVTPGLQFVKVRGTQENINAFVSGVPSDVNPWTYEGAAAVGLGNSYIGHTWEEVQAKFPAMTTPTENVDSEGNTYWSSVLQDTMIA